MKMKLTVLVLVWCVSVCLGDGYFTEFNWSPEFIRNLATGEPGSGNQPTNCNVAASFSSGSQTQTNWLGVTPVAMRLISWPQITTPQKGSNVCVTWNSLIGDVGKTNDFVPFTLNSTNYTTNSQSGSYAQTWFRELWWSSASGQVYGVSIRTNDAFNSGNWTTNVMAIDSNCTIYIPAWPEFGISVWRTNTATSGAWAYRFGSTDVDSAYAVTMDSSNNVLVVGTFYGTVDFDPAHASAASILTNNVAYYAGFIAKYTDSGEFLWVKKFNPPGSPNPKAIATDPSNNIFIGGAFVNCSLMKFDSSGTLLWTNCPPAGSIVSIAVDSQGDVAACGSFNANYLTPLDMGNGQDRKSVV